jgi:hypothetical protein
MAFQRFLIACPSSPQRDIRRAFHRPCDSKRRVKTFFKCFPCPFVISHARHTRPQSPKSSRVTAFLRRAANRPLMRFVGASRLDTDASLAPVSPLGVVSVEATMLAAILYLHLRCCSIADSSSFHCCVLVEVVPDGVASPQADPLWDRSVLLLRFRKLLLRAERFVGLCACYISMLKHV